MDERRFWDLIERAKSSSRGVELALAEQLSEEPPEELFDFQHIFERLFAEANRAELWGAACLALSNPSDQRFADFRAWLIAQGRASYRSALADPDGIAELDFDQVPQQHGLPCVAELAWRQHPERGEFLAALPDVETTEVPFGDARGFTRDGRPNYERLGRAYPRLAERVRSLGRHSTLGSTAPVPQALLHLSSADPSVRGRATKELLAARSSLSAAHVPALVERACDPEMPERRFLLELLCRLAVDEPAHAALSGFDVEAPLFADYFEHAPNRAERYAALESALPALLALLADEDSGVRGRVAMTVAFYARRATRVRQALLEALAREGDGVVRASLIFALSLQERYLHDESRRAAFEEWAREPPPAGVAASIALYGMGDQPSPAALSAMEVFLAGSCESIPELPWNSGDLAGLCLRALGSRLPEHAERIEAICCSIIERARAPDEALSRVAVHAVPVLLWLLLRRAAGPPARDPRLLTLLTRLHERPFLAPIATWQALAQVGLPKDPAHLAAVLSNPEHSDLLEERITLGGRESSLDAWSEAGFSEELGSTLAARADAPAVARALGAAATAAALDGSRRELVSARAMLCIAVELARARTESTPPSAELDRVAALLLVSLRGLGWFAEYLSAVPEERQAALLDAVLVGVHGEPGLWDARLSIEEVLTSCLPHLGAELRGRALEASLQRNFRAVLNLLPCYPSARALASLLPRLAESLDDLASWAPEAVPEAIERDARALARASRGEAELLQRARQGARAPARDLYARALELLAELDAPRGP
ncbi:MAG: DUF4240 domain-containing protein [Polyangiaceae bacterium]